MIDSLNHKKIKNVLLFIRCFKFEKGVQNKLLEV